MSHATPRRKRLHRVARLQSARHWISSYTGKDIVRGYARWFGIDTVCAIVELRKLGLNIDQSRLDQARATEAARAKARRDRQKRRAELAAQTVDPFDSDDHFYYIAGYTPGGFAYGITWEEAEQEGLVAGVEGDAPRRDANRRELQSRDEEIPF